MHLVSLLLSGRCPGSNSGRPEGIRQPLRGCACGLALALGLFLVPVAPARAACSASVSSPVVDLGAAAMGSLPPSPLPGWRAFGPARRLLVTLACDEPRSTLRLRVLQLHGAATGAGGGVALRWDAAEPGGAIRLQLRRALADGHPVNLVGEDGIAAPEREIDREGEIAAFDLVGLAGGARASCSSWSCSAWCRTTSCQAAAPA